MAHKHHEHDRVTSSQQHNTTTQSPTGQLSYPVHPQTAVNTLRRRNVPQKNVHVHDVVTIGLFVALLPLLHAPAAVGPLLQALTPMVVPRYFFCPPT